MTWWRNFSVVFLGQEEEIIVAFVISCRCTRREIKRLTIEDLPCILGSICLDARTLRSWQIRCQTVVEILVVFSLNWLRSAAESLRVYTFLDNLARSFQFFNSKNVDARSSKTKMNYFFSRFLCPLGVSFSNTIMLSSLLL